MKVSKIIKNFFGHLSTINEHRFLVMKHCFRVGLYKQGLTHDLSKYSPTEFIPGVKYFQGDRSPNNAQREHEGYSSAWLHHKGRNRHHYEYWIDYSSKKDTPELVGMKMPLKYVIEMFCDRVAASKTYNKDAYFEFTIDGENTYSDKDINYEIVLNYGDDHATRKTRIKDGLQIFD